MANSVSPPRQETGTTTSTSLVYRQLRRDILFGCFPPEAKLPVDTLRTRYGVSAIPIREALNRLLAEGLVDHAEQKGFLVPPLSVEELRELTETRCWIHETMVRETLKAGGDDWEEALVIAAHRLFKASRNLERSNRLNPEWEALHRAFHIALVAGCPSHWMREFHADLFDYAEFYKNQYLSAAPTEADRDVSAEHRALLDAAIALDGARLTALLNEHTRLTTQIIIENRPDPVAAPGRRARRRVMLAAG
ncbi:MAG: GntR family transcriptional regulator [Burkholderiales bacterium]|nr:GntR family transcriptional regulator [Burkholderiales bacterium]